MKLAAVDLDDTLLGPDKRISQANLAALARLDAAGVEIVIATGRHFTRIADFLAQVPRARWAVTCQGAAVHELAGGEAVQSAYLEPAVVGRLLGDGVRHGLSCVIYAEDQVRSEVGGEFIELYGRYSGGMPRISTRDELIGLRVHKIVWIGAEETVSHVAELQEVRNIPLYQVRTHRNIYEFLPSTASKALGVAVVAERLGIRPDEVVAFGDADNDIPLFAWAGRSIAMPHGSSGAREAAKEIAPSGPAESAFARAIATLDLKPCPCLS